MQNIEVTCTVGFIWILTREGKVIKVKETSDLINEAVATALTRDALLRLKGADKVRS